MPVHVPVMIDTALANDRVSAAEKSPDGSSLPGPELPFAEAQIKVGWDAGRTAKLLRKLDVNLLPFLSLLYLLSFLDRTNIGNGRLAGLEHSLGLDPQGMAFNIAVAVFFPFYIAAEIPSNLAMRRLRPSIWIPCMMIAWGVCCVATGFVRSFGGLIVARCAMGFAEGGLFPGVIYYITLWYRRKECGIRMAVFFSAATAAGAFGGLLARAIVLLDGARGLAGWSWIYIIEGVMTVLVAFVAFWMMHDYPEAARFLTADEADEIVRRLGEDQSVLDNKFQAKYVWQAVTDWRIWVNMFIAIGIFTPLYAVATFLPTIVKNLGYTDTSAQLMSVPPYIAACATCIVGGWAADRHGQRGVWMIGFCVVALVGLAVLIGTENVAASYVACVLVACGIFANVPQSVAWNGNNIGGSTKRGVGIAMQVGFGNFGGVIAGFAYRTGQIRQGHIILFAMTSMSAVLSVVLTVYLRWENGCRDREFKQPALFSRQERLQQRERGDNADFFRYIV